MKDNKHYFKIGLTAFLVILCSMLSYYVIFHIERFTAIFSKITVILMPIIDGLILAYLLTPLVNIIEQKLLNRIIDSSKWKIKIKKKHKRTISILLTIIAVYWLIYGFFSIVIPQLLNSIKSIIEQFPVYVQSLNNLITKLLADNTEIENYLTNLVNRYSINFEKLINEDIIPQLNNIIMTVSMSIYSIFKEFWNLIIGFIISIYVLYSKELFAAQAKKISYALFSVEGSNRLISNVRFAHKTFGGFFMGKILDSLIIGVICFCVTSIIGTPFCVLISVIIGVTNIIPFFGPFLGAIPSAILILLVDPIQAVYFIIFVIILQQLDGNIIGPKILGSSTGLSSFWVIFAITFFGGFLGIFGMVIGVPVFAVIFASVKSIVESLLASRDLPVETSKYLRLLYIETETGNFVDFTDDKKKHMDNVTRIVVKKRNKKNKTD